LNLNSKESAPPMPLTWIILGAIGEQKWMDFTRIFTIQTRTRTFHTHGPNSLGQLECVSIL
jgi:hypothetical protein